MTFEFGEHQSKRTHIGDERNELLQLVGIVVSHWFLIEAHDRAVAQEDGALAYEYGFYNNPNLFNSAAISGGMSAESPLDRSGGAFAGSR